MKSRVKLFFQKMNEIILVDVPKNRLEASVLLGGGCSGRAAGAGVGLLRKEQKAREHLSIPIVRTEVSPFSCLGLSFPICETRGDTSCGALLVFITPHSPFTPGPRTPILSRRILLLWDLI